MVAAAARAYVALAGAAETRLGGADELMGRALQRVADAEVDVRSLGSSLSLLKTQLEQSGEQLSDMIRLVTLTTAEAQRRKGVLALSRKGLAERESRLALLLSEREAGLGEAVPAMLAADQAIGAILDTVRARGCCWQRVARGCCWRRVARGCCWRRLRGVTVLLRLRGVAAWLRLRLGAAGGAPCALRARL
jgi:hypothetical protein